MKISKLFHWLYCAVMFLPLFCLPVYALAVRSDNNYQSIHIQVEETKVVDFNQYIDFDNGYSTNKSGDFYNITYSDNKINIEFDSISSNLYPRLWLVNSGYSVGDVVYIRTPQLTGGGNIGVRGSLNQQNTYLSWFNHLITIDYQYDYIDMYTSFLTSTTSYNQSFNVSFFNLTQMFGSGNEPSIEQFNLWYPSDYYIYNTGEKQLLHTGVYDTLDDTDFGSQTIYTLYKEVDDFFNYDGVLSIGELYDWCEINLFNGNATLGFFIFFHLLEYWLLTSLLWLIFDILMYVPQLCHRWLDKASLE